MYFAMHVFCMSGQCAITDGGGGKKSTYKIIGINCHANPVTRHNIYQSFKGQVGVAFGTFLEEIFACFRVDFF